MILSLFLATLSYVTVAHAQVKACYAWDGSSSGNFPCDPEAEVCLAQPASISVLTTAIGERMLWPWEYLYDKSVLHVTV